MKTTHTLLALVASVALGCTAFAGSTAAARPMPVKPVITELVRPTELPRSFQRKVVKVRFALDAQGQPQQIQVLSRTDDRAKEQIVAAFKEWRFDVAALGQDVQSKRFVLPLDIIPRA